MNTKPIFPNYMLRREYFSDDGSHTSDIEKFTRCKISIFSMVRYKYNKVWYKLLFSESTMFSFEGCSSMLEIMDLSHIRERDMVSKFVEKCYKNHIKHHL